MVSFDPYDVIFLLNKWDTFLKADRKEKFFKDTKKELCTIWENVKPTRILKFSMNKVFKKNSCCNQFKHSNCHICMCIHKTYHWKMLNSKTVIDLQQKQLCWTIPEQTEVFLRLTQSTICVKNAYFKNIYHYYHIKLPISYIIYLFFLGVWGV